MDRIYDILSEVAEATKKIKAQDNENESPEMEMQEYKQDFYEMSVASIRAIANHANAIISSLDNPLVKENLTESWLQGRIAITEDYMRTIHDFVMYTREEGADADSYNDINEFELGPSTMKNLDDLYGDDESNDPLNNTNAAIEHLKKAQTHTSSMIEGINSQSVKDNLTFAMKYGRIEAVCKTMGELHDFVMFSPLSDDDKSMIASGGKPGLWENIRKKKEKMGKNYKPAKPGDKDRPDSDQWKKLTDNK